VSAFLVVFEFLNLRTAKLSHDYGYGGNKMDFVNLCGGF
jgi:hypothetical protein